MKHFPICEVWVLKSGKYEEQCLLACNVMLCSLVHTGRLTSCGHTVSWLSVIKKVPINMGTLSSYCSMGLFLILVSKLQWTVHTTHAVVLYALWPEQLAGDKQIPSLSGHFHVWYSHLSGKVWCGRGWDFLQPALYSGQCKLKAVSFIKFIRWCLNYFILYLFCNP
jgi:hypothetical protein